MATSVSINSVTYNDFATAFSNNIPAAGVYHALPDVGKYPCFDALIHDRREITFPGVPWTGEKDYSLDTGRKRLIYIDMVFVGTSATLRSNLKTFQDGVDTNTRYTVVVGGQSFPGCKLAGPSGPAFFECSFKDIVVQAFRFVFKQLSDSN